MVKVGNNPILSFLKQSSKRRQLFRERVMKVGKVLWWSERDRNGVITDSKGNEYYFDSSVADLKKVKKLDRGAVVLFEPSRCDEILAAKSVTFPNSKSVEKYLKTFEQEKYQLNLPLAV